MTIRTVFSTLFIFVLPLLMLGCDGGGSAMEQEPQQMEELKLSIYHPPESNAQAKSTIERSASELKTDDLLNIFVTGDNEREALGVEYPEQGETTVAVFTVPAGNYDVDLLGFRQIENANGNSFNSAVVFATTGDNQNVTVNSGEVTEVNFDGGAASDGLLTSFGLSFNANLDFRGNNNGGASRQIDVTLEDESGDAQTALADRIFQSDTPFGGVAFDPIDDGSDIVSGDRSSARDPVDFTSRSGATLSTDGFNLSAGQYRDGNGNDAPLKASVLLELRISDEYIDTQTQDPVYLYNSVNGSAESEVTIGDDGGIIVII